MNLKIIPNDLLVRIFGEDEDQSSQAIEKGASRRLNDETEGKQLTTREILLKRFDIKSHEIHKFIIPVLAVCVILALIAIGLNYTIKRLDSPCLKKVLRSIKAKLMLNSFLRYLLQTF